jgi:hypothetical protein
MVAVFTTKQLLTKKTGWQWFSQLKLASRDINGAAIR